MLVVPKEFTNLMTTFAPLFTKRVWQHVQVLLVGAILSPGKRTITAVLRVMGLAHAKAFQQFHRVLNRARRRAARGPGVSVARASPVGAGRPAFGGAS